VEVVAATLQRPELVTAPEAQQLVTDRALASRIQVALATNPETRKYRITVEAKSGLVTLEGTAAMDEAVDVARAVRGVREVKTQQVEVPPIPPFVA
jgi:osmotically-inducible protein OsmY